MAYRGPTFFPRNTQTDTPATGTCDLDDSGTSTTFTSVTQAGSTSAVFIVQYWCPAGGGTVLSKVGSGGSTQLANNQGWWIPPTTGMAVTGSNLRVIPAGSVLSVKASATCISTLGTAFTTTVRAYKRSTAGVLTSLTSGSSASITSSAGGTTSVATANATFASEATFATGETLYIEFYFTIPQQAVTAASGSIAFGPTTPWVINTPNGVAYRIASSSAATGSGTAAQQPTTVGVKRLVTATGVATLGTRAVSVFKTFSGTGTPAATKQVAPTPKAATGTGTAAYSRVLNALRPFSVTGTGTPSVRRSFTFTKVAIGTGVAIANRTVSASRSFSVAGTGTAFFARSVITARSFTATGTGVAKASVQITTDILNRISGTGGTIINVTKKIINVFD